MALGGALQPEQCQHEAGGEAAAVMHGSAAHMGSMMAAFAEGMRLADRVSMSRQLAVGKLELVAISHLQDAAALPPTCSACTTIVRPEPAAAVALPVQL
jgi:hypothetical protein